MPKVIDKEAYRSDLKREAVRLFSENGFEGLTMKQLARALGISHALFYYYFETKEALFLQMTEQLAQELLAGLTESFDAARGIKDKVTQMLLRAEARDTDLQHLQRLMSDYVRLSRGAIEGGSAALENLVGTIRLGFQARLGVSNAQMDVLFTIALGVLQGRSVYPAGTRYEMLRARIGELVCSDYFAALDDRA